MMMMTTTTTNVMVWYVSSRSFFVFSYLADKTLRRIPMTTYCCRDREGLMLEDEGVVVVAYRRT